MFSELCKEFRPFHQNTLNVVLHLLTTPIGWACTFRLIADACASEHAAQYGVAQAVGQVEVATGLSVPYLLAVVYSVIMFAATPFGIAVLNLLINLVCAYVAVNLSLPFGVYGTACLLAVAYGGQDLAHYATGEATYQSSYGVANVAKLAVHTFFLIPLCIDAYLQLRRGAMYWLCARDTTVMANVNESCADSLKCMRKWVIANNPSADTTTHWWYHDLRGDAKKAFDTIANAPQLKKAFAEVWDSKAYNVDIVHGMNEVYVASPTQMKSSDAVFLMNHIDGPWLFWPFCTVYRVLAAVNENRIVTTELVECRRSTVLSTGDLLGFDFNRELHKIHFDETKTNPEPRITLKLHYVAYPKILKPFGMGLAFVTTQYDILARNLFLYTIKPTTFMQKLSARIGVLFTTYLFDRFEHFLGVHNVLRALAIFAACYFVDLKLSGARNTQFLTYFWYATSFIHYMTYIATYYYRSDINYGRFQRDVIFWKALSIGQLFLYFFTGYSPDAVSIAMIAVGYTLGGLAAGVIGVDRTYFGSELEIVRANWINAFPYNTIPHPMILGAIVALAGFHYNASFRADHPFLIPVHIGLYLTHAMQEHFDVHDKNWKNLERYETRLKEKTA
ncbi:hypothetical protein DIPPA_27280 [Diplonema papillatum]|nr:hypothetical protein DIPPA_27280 [Diplonema papillatum]